MSEAAPKPIIGFRAWRVEPTGKLKPLYDRRGGHNPWNPRGTIKAVCQNGGAAAHTHCPCGLYGHYTAAGALQELPALVAEDGVFGVFVGFGSTVPCERGFRAGEGRVVGFLRGGIEGGTSKKRQELAVAAASLYEVPLKDDFDGLLKEALKWGETREAEGTAMDMITTAMNQVMAVAMKTGSIFSSYRFQEPPASGPGHSFHGGGYLGFGAPCVPRGYRVTVELEIARGVELVSYEAPGGGRKLDIKGLPPGWVVRSYTQEIERIDIPLPGQNRMQLGQMRGAVRLTAELEATIRAPQSNVDKDLRELAKIGRVENYEVVPVV